MKETEVRNISAWLIGGARPASSAEHMVGEFCERLVRAGLPLWRVGLFVRTLHPDILGVNFIWKPGAEVVVGTADFGLLDSPEFIHSPLAVVFGERREGTHRIDDPESTRFP